MKHIKTFFRNTTIGDRLNHYIAIHIHCGKTDQHNMVELAGNFKDGNQARLQVFGNF